MKFKLHFEHSLRNTGFLNFDELSNYFYRFKKESAKVLNKKTTDGRFPDQGNFRHQTTILKWDLVHSVNTFWNTSLRIYAAGKASLVRTETII